MTESVHPAAFEDDALLAQCELRRLRRSGPGGQHRNKVETAVVLRHRPSGVIAEANERRCVRDNKRVALRRLRIKLAMSIRIPVVAGCPASELWQSRVRGGRMAVNAAHTDFPALLAEALDVLHAYDADLRAAAECLQVTPTQLMRLFRKEPCVFVAVNEDRKKHGLRPWK
ncbi:MAG: peptide chain release factor-like protein [Planctomycetes bacterium]|nr:peptide chain release factor-like protein [Planctomycetota bacterium]